MRFISYLYIAAGIAITIGITIYHIVFHPEWTQAQALRELWGFVVIALAITMTGFYLLCAKD
jgi:hypothetical protein